MAKSIAHQKPLTPNPGTTMDASITSKALITKVKRPRVKIFIGRVNITTIGLMKALMAPKTTANIKAEKNPAIETPGNK